MDVERVLRLAADVELAAEELMADREEIVNLDRRRNANREALRATRKTNDRSVWTLCGTMFVKMPRGDFDAMLKRDQKRIDAEIDALRDALPRKVDELQRLQNEKPSGAEAFAKLKPLDKNELKLATKP